MASSPSLANLQPAAATLVELAELAERELGLPAGAWRRRKLFALRVALPGLEELGIRCGDLLIIEPGQRANCDHLVVIRQAASLMLRRVIGPDYNAKRGVLLIPPEPGALPFPLTALPPDVVGTVIGVVAKRLSTSGRRDGSPRVAEAAAPVLRTLNAQRLDANLSRWCNWIDPPRLGRDFSPASKHYRQMLGARLRILGSCMAVAANRRLYGALLAEASRVIMAMQREAGHNNGPALLPLLPLSSRPFAAPQHKNPGNPQYAHTVSYQSA